MTELSKEELLAWDRREEERTVEEIFTFLKDHVRNRQAYDLIKIYDDYKYLRERMDKFDK
jgi:hypothetical protein